MADTDSGRLGSGGFAPQACAIETGSQAARMQRATVPATAEDSPINSHWEFFYRVAERFGIPAVLLILVLWWARNDLIQPLLDAHFEFIHKVTDAQVKHTQELQNIGGKLDTLIRVSEK